MKHQIILSLLISLTATVGDHLVFDSTLSESHIYRGIVDNLVHAAIGMVSSVLFMYDTAYTREAIAVNVAFCTALSSFIDFDHVIVARSIYWKDLKNFKHRGIFHCSSIWLSTSIVLIAWSQIYRRINVNVFGWMCLIAFASHHVRDANRRGFWLWPFGHTRAVNKYVYIVTLTLLPTVCSYIYREMKPGMLRYKTVNYNIV